MFSIALIREDLSVKGGEERIASILSKELSKKYTVHLMNLYKNNIAYKISDDVKFVVFNENKNKLSKSIFVDSKKIRKYLIKNNIKVVLIIGRTAVLQTMLATIGTKIKVVFCHHHAVNIDNYTVGVKEKIRKKLIYLFIKCKADKIVTLTNKDRVKYYIYSKHFNPERVISIYNFLDEKLLDKLKVYDIFSNKIITVGRIDYAKGYEYLIQVAKLVFEKHQDWEWHIYGEGDKDYKEDIIKMIKRNGLEHKVILMGNKDNIYDLYQDYAFFVMTSRYESFGMVLLEAKAKKLPIISFDIDSGPSDIIRNEIDGFLVEAFNIEKMAEKICILIENKKLRQKFSDNTYGNINKFSKDNIIKQWSELIEKCFY